MPRALFEKVGSAAYISHLDLMRLFQRAFKRAGLPLTHTHGFNPRPSVSIALPMSLGMESRCELLDFDLEGEPLSGEKIRTRLNGALIDGVRVLEVYDSGRKLKELSLMDCQLVLEYDSGVPADARERLEALFSQEEVVVEKKGKQGPTPQNIAPLIRSMEISTGEPGELMLQCRICCQNPSLNPTLIVAAITKYLPDYAPDFVRCCRLELYDAEETVFR